MIYVVSNFKAYVYYLLTCIDIERVPLYRNSVNREGVRCDLYTFVRKCIQVVKHDTKWGCFIINY